LDIVNSKDITRLAKGHKRDLYDGKAGALQLKELFPDLVTLITDRFIVIRNGTVVHDSDDNDFLLEVGDIANHLIGSYGKTIIIGSNDDGHVKVTNLQAVPEFDMPLAS
jgi:hypothetical protein